jgi:hypothetical protein
VRTDRWPSAHGLHWEEQMVKEWGDFGMSWMVPAVVLLDRYDKRQDWVKRPAKLSARKLTRKMVKRARKAEAALTKKKAANRDVAQIVKQQNARLS